jgi:hypothetical protein
MSPEKKQSKRNADRRGEEKKFGVGDMSKHAENRQVKRWTF